MWASERSDERHARRGAPSQEPVGTDPKTGFQVSPYFLTLQVSSCSFLRSAVACPRSWYFQDIDNVGSEVPGNSSGPPARWCSPEARLSPTLSCPMSWRGSDGTMAIDGLFVFWHCYSYLWSFSALSVVPALSLLTVLLVLLYSSVFLVS